MLPLLVVGLVAVPMLLEAALSRRNERRLRALGAREPPGDVYAAMQIVYPLIFVAMSAEGVLGGATWSRPAAAGLVLFALAKGLKYGAVMALGPRWTFRVLVPPGSRRTRRGPYHWLRHPNYVAVVGEIVGVALMMSALVTGLVSMVLFGRLLWQRIAVEEHALDEVDAVRGAPSQASTD